MRKLKVLATALAVGVMSLVMVMVPAHPAQASVGAGNISLKVTAFCFVGDTVNSFWIWTPEKGKVYGPRGTMKSVIDLGTFRKNVSGDTYFNWGLDVRHGQMVPARSTTVGICSRLDTISPLRAVSTASRARDLLKIQELRDGGRYLPPSFFLAEAIPYLPSFLKIS